MISGTTKSIPNKLSSGNITPLSTIKISLPYSNTVIFFPTSPIPPKNITFKLVFLPLEDFETTLTSSSFVAIFRFCFVLFLDFDFSFKVDVLSIVLLSFLFKLDFVLGFFVWRFVDLDLRFNLDKSTFTSSLAIELSNSSLVNKFPYSFIIFPFISLFNYLFFIENTCLLYYKNAKNTPIYTLVLLHQKTHLIHFNKL